MSDLNTLTPREFARLAHTAKGFGANGRFTLVEWIEFQVAALRVMDCLDNIQASLGDMQTTLARHPPPR